LEAKEAAAPFRGISLQEFCKRCDRKSFPSIFSRVLIKLFSLVIDACEQFTANAIRSLYWQMRETRKFYQDLLKQQQGELSEETQGLLASGENLLMRSIRQAESASVPFPAPTAPSVDDYPQ
jgi:hypothetical protein